MTVRARLHQDPRFLLFQVSDTGCGIDPEMTERIFERLHQVSERIQASRKGLGLGLYICRELVRRQGGQIWVSVSRNRAARFRSRSLFLHSTPDYSAPETDAWPAESVALVMVEVCFVDAWPSKESQAEWSS